MRTMARRPLIMFSSLTRQDFYILATFVYADTDIKVIARGDRGIETATDLRGKKVGTAVGTTGQFFLDAFLTANKLPAHAPGLHAPDNDALKDLLRKDGGASCHMMGRWAGSRRTGVLGAKRMRSHRHPPRLHWLRLSGGPGKTQHA